MCSIRISFCKETVHFMIFFDNIKLLIILKNKKEIIQRKLYIKCQRELTNQKIEEDQESTGLEVE